MEKFIIGLGTGRCGTTSLSKLLSLQPDIYVPHEYGKPLPWQFAKEEIDIRISELEKMNGDVAFYYLNYVEYLIERFPGVKFICLRRDREETVDSYMKKSQNRNNWIEHDGTVWEKAVHFYDSYPKFKTDSKREALGMYYDLYYSVAEKFETKMANRFRIFDIKELNSATGVRNILNFAGFLDDEMKMDVGISVNAT